MQGCVSQRYLPFALHIPSNAIHYNIIIVITLDWLYLGFLTQESSLAQICTLSAFTRNLQRHSTPTVGFEPTDLSAHQFSRLLAYNHLHTLAYSLIKPPSALRLYTLPGIFQNHRLLLLTVIGLISLEKFFHRTF